MDDAPGPLIATGRAADVYDLGDGTVLRRYRSDHDVSVEAKVMGWTRAHGYPVPEVHRAEGRDLVMDRVDGPTLLADLEAHPWRLVHHARLLARLQLDLAELRAPDWLSSVGPGDGLVHLDLHPMNVLLGPDGPVVIDWTNAARGPSDLDAAWTYVVMSTFEGAGLLQRLGLGTFVRVFARARGRAAIDRQLRAACALRLADPGTTPGERVAVEALEARAAGRAG